MEWQVEEELTLILDVEGFFVSQSVASFLTWSVGLQLSMGQDLGT